MRLAHDVFKIARSWKNTVHGTARNRMANSVALFSRTKLVRVRVRVRHAHMIITYKWPMQ